MKKLRVLDLFSGIGGFSLGLERTGGFETIAFCEIEEYPRKVLRRHWPGVPIFEDVRKLEESDVKPIDVICGGFPCQDISPSGRGEGIDGERSGLWAHMVRLCGFLRPNLVIVENSSNLLAGNGGRWFGRVLGDLAALGLDAEWHVIPIAATGAPHLRERCWIIAYPAGIGQSGQGQLLQSIYPEENAYREASQLVHAFREGTLPFVCRGHDGVSSRVARDRLTALGNAIGPEIAFQIGKSYLEATCATRT